MIFEYSINGLTISDLVGDQFISRSYIGYSKSESIKLFKQYIRELKE